MRRLALVVVALAVTVGACGGGSGSSSDSTSGSSAPAAKELGAAQLIAAAPDKADAAKTARISGEVTVEVKGETKTLPLEGALDFRSGAFEFSYDFSQLGLPGADGAKIKARMVDGAMYMSFGDLGGKAASGLESMLGGKTWVKMDLASLGATGATGGLAEANPGGTLDALRGAGSVETVGTETIRGVSTTHYRATIDPQKALNDAPPELRAQAEKGLALLGGSLPIDVWIDGDGQARKVSMDVETKGVNVATTIEYYDFGAAVDVTAPPADDVLDFAQMFSGLGPGAGDPAI